ncbi:MAG: hypothetical protein KF881_04305 [Acidobacteria bacterium]|nr:hypothetical protein [Acidobacteriota bacterium]
MKRPIFASIILAVYCLLICSALIGQASAPIDQGWRWVIPLATNRAEIERAFGDSITKDKSSPFQTYVADFGKITINYAVANQYIKECSCAVSKGTVIEAMISPYRFPISRLNLNLDKFTKDSTFSPRELSYFNKDDGILIVTEIVETSDRVMVERVVWIEYRPRPKPLH